MIIAKLAIFLVTLVYAEVSVFNATFPSEKAYNAFTNTMFRQMDVNGDERVTSQEFSIFLQRNEDNLLKYGQNATIEFEVLDVDQDGMLTRVEFHSNFRKKLEESPLQNAQNVTDEKSAEDIYKKQYEFKCKDGNWEESFEKFKKCIAVNENCVPFDCDQEMQVKTNEVVRQEIRRWETSTAIWAVNVFLAMVWIFLLVAFPPIGLALSGTAMALYGTNLFLAFMFLFLSAFGVTHSAVKLNEAKRKFQ